MSENRKNHLTPVSGAENLEEIGEYWDRNSLADCDEVREAHFEVVAERRVAIEPDIYRRLAFRARERGMRPETLANLWLAERLRRDS